MATNEWLHVDALKPWEKNPRKNDPAVPKVAASIERFGFVAPIVIWKGGNRMVAGHTRLKAMRSLLAQDPNFVAKGAPGPAMVRVVFHEFANEADADAYALADNKLATFSEWDYSLLTAAVSTIGDDLASIAGFSQTLLANQNTPVLIPQAPPPTEQRVVSFIAGGAGGGEAFKPANDPREEWVGMPGFESEDQTAWKSIIVHFAEPKDMQAFAELVNQSMTEKTKSIWFPYVAPLKVSHVAYEDAVDAE